MKIQQDSKYVLLLEAWNKELLIWVGVLLKSAVKILVSTQGCGGGTCT